MASLQQIRRVVGADYAAYERFLRRSLRSGSDYLDVILDYIFERRGKGLRPLLALLSAALNRDGGQAGEGVFTGAMIVEMIHTASLVHDDVVDEAYIRHGAPSVNALWRSHNAVIAGDFILARGFSIGLGGGHYRLLTHIAGCLDALCEGEIEQGRRSDSLSMTREQYFDIIYKKTASLISVCCTSGALSEGAPESAMTAMKLYGDNLGLAFQIRDDILDYTGSMTGKPRCQDLRERKITLPLLALLEKSSAAHRRELVGLLAQARTRPQNVEKLHGIVLAEGGVELAAQTMNSHIDNAITALDRYPDSPYKQALVDIARFVAERNE
ncbi:MAG: polyprenyl synthetase family protein [Rikenellaceae bacterium]|nr:polyprenyl synthetase family protein [Rikenellaceae bacterium]